MIPTHMSFPPRETTQTLKKEERRAERGRGVKNKGAGLKSDETFERDHDAGAPWRVLASENAPRRKKQRTPCFARAA